MVENTYAKNAIKTDFYFELWFLKYSQNSGYGVELVPTKDTTTRKKSAEVVARVPLYHGNQVLYHHTNQFLGALYSRDDVRFAPTKKIAEPTVKPHHRSTAINAKQNKFFEQIHTW